MKDELLYQHLLKNGLWTELTGGTNQVFLVSDQNKSYVVKIPKPAAKALIDRQNEYQVSQITAQAGINLTLCYFDLDSGINITPYQANSQILTAELLRGDSVWQACADLLRNLHHNLPVKFPRNIDIFAVIEFYKQQAADNIPADLIKLLKSDYIIDQFREEIAAMTIPALPCHNDTILSNFLLTPSQKLYLIDWEYAGNHDPCWDLATLMADAEFTSQQEQQFLTYYFQRTPSPAELRRVIIYKILSNYLWALWCIVMNNLTHAYQRLNSFEKMLSL